MAIVLPGNTTTTFTELFVWANNTTNNLVGYGILLMVFSMVFFSTQRYGATASHATLSALVTTTMVCGALTLMGVTSSWLLTIITLLMMGSYIYTYHN